MTLNERLLPKLVTDGIPGGATVLKDSYSYDPNGNVLGIADSAAAGLTSRTMIYDAADRLLQVSAPKQWGTALYGYDALDNLRSLTRTNQVVALGYDSTTNRLNGLTVNNAGLAVAHNDKGQLTQRGTLNLFWDADGRIKNTSGSASQTYGYDGHGRRVSLRRADGSQVIFVYSQQGELLHSETISTTGTIGGKTRYHYLDGKLVGQVAGPTTYVHTDGLGSPTVRTDANGAVISKTQYDPWGDTWAGAEPNLVGYTGHVNDSATGLVYAQQRYYDPVIGRFLSADPVRTDADTGRSFNRYRYATNNPFRFADPDGRDPEDIYERRRFAQECNPCESRKRLARAVEERIRAKVRLVQNLANLVLSTPAEDDAEDADSATGPIPNAPNLNPQMVEYVL